MSYHFILKRKGFGYNDIYEAIKTGEKTSEWRKGSEHWKRRLLTEMGRKQIKWAYEFRERNREVEPYFVMSFNDYLCKHKKARFVAGYTKTPMLIADVECILFHSKTNQFEIRIKNVKEVLNNEC